MTKPQGAKAKGRDMRYHTHMMKTVKIIGAGLAGSQAALWLADCGYRVQLVEMRPIVATPVHRSGDCAELVCSNSLKSTNAESAAGMLKGELATLGSHLYRIALAHRVPAGGALAVDRERFSQEVTRQVTSHPNISLVLRTAASMSEEAQGFDALVLATGPLTEGSLARDIERCLGRECLAFFDAAAPIVLASSIDSQKVFRQSRYEEGAGDYLNAAFTKDEYDAFIGALLEAQKVIAKSFETKDLFQACQPIEELARSGWDTPRFGPMKPVGLIDPRTGRRPWAALQLRAEDAYGQSYNLVGFQTNLTFPEQDRVFRLIPGLEHAEFARHGVMHRNTFVNAPQVLDSNLCCALAGDYAGAPVYFAGQLCGTEGYVEAIRSGLHAAIAVDAALKGVQAPDLPAETAFGSLMGYATSPDTMAYQPSHVNFGLFPPLEQRIRNKRDRYAAYASRGAAAFASYCARLQELALIPESARKKS